MKDRIVNIRPLFIIFVGMILGILTFYCGFNTFSIGKNITVFIILVVVFLLFLLLTILSFIPKTTFLKLISKFKYLFLSFIVSILIGALLTGIWFSSYNSRPILNGTYSCTGYVSESIVDNRNLKVVLNDCIVSGDRNYDIESIELTIASCDELIEVGTRVSFTGKLSSTRLLTDENNVIKFYKDKTYRMVVSFDDITIGDSRDVNLIDSIRDKIKASLEDNLNEENSAIAYAMLIGDKSGIDTENYNLFSYAGISHILAVSGLHVGFLVGLLLLLLSLFKTKDSTNLIIVSIILFLYCILCKMTPSVVRASIMAIVLLASKCIGEEYDALSSLSFAGIIILFINPIQLFDVGFQLSFLCVLSIITLSKYITELLVKIHLPKAIASLLALSICINLAIYPLCTNIFESVSLLGIFTNLIIVPFFSIAFPVLFVCTFLTTIMPFMGFVLVVPELMLHAIKIICTWITSINFGNFIVFNWGYLVVFLTILLLLVVKFVMLKPKIKNYILAGLLTTVMVLVIIGQVPNKYSKDTILTWSQYDTIASVVVVDDNYKVLVDYDKYSTAKSLKKYKISKLNEWIYPSFDLTKINETRDFVVKYKVRKLILPKYEAFNEYSLAKLEDVCDIVFVEDRKDFKNYSLEFHTSATGTTYAVSILSGKSILFDVSMTKSQMENFDDTKKYDYCITQSEKYNLIEYINGVNKIYSTTLTKDKNGVKSIGQKSKYVLKL